MYLPLTYVFAYTFTRKTFTAKQNLGVPPPPSFSRDYAFSESLACLPYDSIVTYFAISMHELSDNVADNETLLLFSIHDVSIIFCRQCNLHVKMEQPLCRRAIVSCSKGIYGTKIQIHLLGKYRAETCKIWLLLGGALCIQVVTVLFHSTDGIYNGRTFCTIQN